MEPGKKVVSCKVYPWLDLQEEVEVMALVSGNKITLERATS
jgi:hypothetical protein